MPSPWRRRHADERDLGPAPGAPKIAPSSAIHSDICMPNMPAWMMAYETSLLSNDPFPTSSTPVVRHDERQQPAVRHHRDMFTYRITRISTTNIAAATTNPMVNAKK